MRHRTIPLWLVAAGLLIAACTATPASTPATPVDGSQTDPATVAPTAEPTATSEPLAALVNGQAILLASYEQQAARYEASMAAAGQDVTTPEGEAALAEGREWVLNLMIEQALIEQAAGQAGVTVTEEELEFTIAQLRQEIGDEAFEGWLQSEGLSLDEMRVKLHSDMVATKMATQIAESIPSQAEHIHARHILVNTEEEARQILSQLQAGEDFATLARSYSQDISTRDAGGDLGVFPLGVLTSPEVESVAFSLQPGQLSDVIASPLGFHIVQTVERIADMEIAPENLRLMRDQAVQNWLDHLHSTADIQRFVTPAP